MPLYEKHISLLFGIWKIEESVSELSSMLEDNERYVAFLENCKSESRKKEWLAVRVLLKELLSEEQEVAYHSDGRPFLPGRPDCSISISHTKGYVAVYCEEGKKTGVDIEYRSDRIRKIKHKFLSEEELAWINPNQEIAHLLICWCAKETLFKLMYAEEVDFRQDLHLEPFVFGYEGEIKVWETKTEQRESFILRYQVTPEFVLTFNR